MSDTTNQVLERSITGINKIKQEGDLRVSNNFDNFFEAIKEISTSQMYKYKEDAYLKFKKKGIPSSKSESWRYTNLIRLLPENILVDSGRETTLEFSPVTNYENVITLRHSDLVSSASRIADKEFIKIYSTLDELPSKYYKERKSGESVSLEPLYLLNTALFNKIIFIDIPRDKSVNLEIKYILDSKTDNNIIFPRVFVNLEQGSQCNLVENFVNYGDCASISNHVLEVFCEKGSKFNHVKLQNLSEEDIHLSSIYLDLVDEVIAKTVSLNFGSKLTRNEVYPVLEGERSDAWLLGANIISKSQHVDNFTCIEHVAPNCESHELYKGIYGDSSKGIFTGTIIVREEAQKTNAYQSNASLLCSDDAESVSRPQLKIWADDVKCSHGATVGQLDEDALFYLRSRGISEAEAKAILTNAYISDVLEHIEDEGMRSHVQTLLESKLKTILN